MAQSNKEALFSEFSGFIEKYVLQPIVDYALQKGDNYTVEELSAVLDLPTKSSLNLPATRPVVGVTIPSAVSPSGGKTAVTGKRTTKSISDDQKCLYVFTKGKRGGEGCSSRRREGHLTCGTHQKYEDKVRSTAPNPISSVPPISAPLTGPSLPNGNKIVTPLPTPPQVKITVSSIGDGFFYEPNSNIIIRQGPDKTHVACGDYDKESQTIMPLTEAQIEYCISRNIAYVKPGVEAQQQLPPGAHAKITNELQKEAGAPAAMPKIGALTMTTKAVAPKIPLLPKVGQLNMPSGMPSVMPSGMSTRIPVVPNVTNMPNVPHVSNEPDDDEEDYEEEE